MGNSEKNTEAIYDAKQLGTGKTLVLGLQHMFAMFGATVLVPAITGLNVSTTLFFAGIGTLLFHLITGLKVPAFLGSSFAFLGAYGLVTASGQAIPLTYSSFGVAVAGAVYLILALFFKTFGAKKVMRYFPPHRYRPHHHLHRPDPGRHRHHQLHCQLDCGSGRHPHCCGLQHLGQGHDQDRPHPAGCGRLLSGRYGR